MLALSIRQPYAELILRGVKRIEYRSRATKIVGERFYIYASKGGGWRNSVTQPSPEGRRPWSIDLSTKDDPPAWMLVLADALILGDLPTGVIVGSAVIERVTPPDPADGHGLFHWHLAGVERIKTLRKPKGHPQPVWWRPF